jgi:anti-anti-sigma regulatory factor
MDTAMNLPEVPKIILKQFPETCDRAQERAFLNALNAELAKTVRPSVVLDCARMRDVDSQMLNLLLCCLEETMKRNGDVRLAAIPAHAHSFLESAGVRHLFRIFATCPEAVNSFRRPAVVSMPQPRTSGQTDSAANAA